MSDLREAMGKYLEIRSSLGFEIFKIAGTLRSFVTFAEKETSPHISTDLVLRGCSCLLRRNRQHWLTGTTP